MNKKIDLICENSIFFCSPEISLCLHARNHLWLCLQSSYIAYVKRRKVPVEEKSLLSKVDWSSSCIHLEVQSSTPLWLLLFEGSNGRAQIFPVPLHSNSFISQFVTSKYLFKRASGEPRAHQAPGRAGAGLCQNTLSTKLKKSLPSASPSWEILRLWVCPDSRKWKNC